MEEPTRSSYLDDPCQRLYEMFARRTGATLGRMRRVVRVARTIASMAGEERIAARHLAEACQYGILGVMDPHGEGGY